MPVYEDVNMGKKRTYVIPKKIAPEEFKELRKSLQMTQLEIADFLGCSKASVERWEAGKVDITGPVVTLIELLKRDKDIPDMLAEPDQRYKLRLVYMYKNTVCTIIDVDEFSRKVKIKNYVKEPLFKAFGVNTEPTFEEYEEFIESRCFPKTRDKLKLELARLDIPFYDPILIIEKTEGRMSDDDFWIRIDR